MQNEDVLNLAERIAKLIATESGSVDLSSLQKSIDSIHERLDKLEAASSISNFKFQISNPSHPSQDRFAIAEAIVDNLFDQQTKEKACTFEPNGKPCDHCSMCNSLGF